MSKSQLGINSGASNSSIGGCGGGGVIVGEWSSYSQVYDSLMHKFRAQKRTVSSQAHVYQTIERHFRDKNICAIQPLANGPNSAIFIGKQLGTDKQMVIKVILKNVVEQAGGSVIKRSLDFGKIHKSSHIAPLYEMATIGGNYLSLVTEYYPKGSLAKLIIANGPLQENVARDIFRMALQGLLNLHNNKIAHRNIKCENILLDANNRPMLTDFSYSLVMEDFAKLNQVMSLALPYLAPEIQSKMPYDPIGADVWSFGVCIFIALNDCLPFGVIGKINPSDFAFVLKPSVEQSLSPAVKNCLKAMLQLDVNKRATTPALEREEWFRK